jgi:hypothetical protein
MIEFLLILILGFVILIWVELARLVVHLDH